MKRNINDIVYGLISVDGDMIKIIDTPIFQRLGHIKQLTSAEYVFPGARHTRKEHSIGAMYLAGKYSYALELNDYDTKVVKIASLLHDVCHGPYSHSWDTIIYTELYPKIHKGHDKHRHKVLNVLLSSIMNDIEIKISDISEVWNGQNLVLSAILQGPLGCDRGDFLRRDTLYTATQHFGNLEMDRIINGSSIYTKNDDIKVLAYDEDVISDAIQGLNSRLYLYNKVYLHKTVIAAAILIEAALKLSKNYFNFVDKTDDLEQFIYLNDSVLDHILATDVLELEDARYYARRSYNRELPKMISEEIIYLSPENNREHIPGICIDNEKKLITWTGRVLSNDFAREFDKYDIHVVTKKGTVPFIKYWHNKNSHYQIETYYIKRIYSL